MRSSDLQSDYDLDSIRNSCDVFASSNLTCSSRRHCKGDELSNSTGEVRDSSSTVREPNRLRAQVDIPKMRGEASLQVTGGVGVEKASKRHYAKVAQPDAEGDGSEVVAVRKVSRVSTNRSEASGSGGSFFKSPQPQK